MKTFEEAIDAIHKDLKDLMVKKQRDYGHGNIADFGEFGVLIRTNDKINRLKNLFKKGGEPQNEAIDDTWSDIANYALIALMLRRGVFLLPLKEDYDNERTEGIGNKQGSVEADSSGKEIPT